ncbi:hypothetical protein HPP92_026181 [Vanilla planifolia]|uniref:ABC transporter domain-containing protein n=1 Tax=Vanilla planifolia TaxID=51239 RepID=A0A835PG48_VANPL|nr:hypothetical protein HPP92_026181 [Vanilla planifolia]
MEGAIREEIEFSVELTPNQSIRNRSVQAIDQQDSGFFLGSFDNPLPILLKFVDVKCAVRRGSVDPLRSALANLNFPRRSAVRGSRTKKRNILKGITGSVGPGEILALMGPSGSGKTTLLNILGGRFDGSDSSGTVTYNDSPYTPALKRRIGFVTQDDVLFPQLTVEETLVFAAFLRLPRGMTREHKHARAFTVIEQLGLDRCRHTKVGGAFVRGISGGERKRTSIGYEILVDPSLLLLDEPTSGLDSTSANKLLGVLQSLARAGRTIITTIHQPSSRIFYKFDKLLLISDGYPIYHGKARDSIRYFSSLGFVPEIAMNPAEFLLDLASGQVNDIIIPEVLQNLPSPQDFVEIIKFLQLKYKSEIETKEKENHNKIVVLKHLSLAIQVNKDWTIGWLEQFFVISKRTFKERYMDYLDMLKIFQSIGVAGLLGLLWWKSRIGTEAQLKDQVGLIFYICIFWTTSSIFGAAYVFPFEKAYLVKEKKVDMYKLSVYYVCSTICDVIANALHPTIFMIILYFMADLRRTAAHFFLTLIAVLLIVVTSQGAGELFGAASLDVKRAGFMASLVLMLFLLTGGYYVQHLPSFMRWMKYTSFMHYGFRLLLKVQYSGGILYACQSRGGCQSLQSSPSFDTINLNGPWNEIWILVAMSLAYRLFAYFCLRRRINLASI